jgi:hypothetical protein
MVIPPGEYHVSCEQFGKPLLAPLAFTELSVAKGAHRIRLSSPWTMRTWASSVADSQRSTGREKM